jgi:HupE / UreJ protein
MRGKLALAITGLVLFCGKAAFAHRIDEYLQATIFSLEEGRVQAAMRLIPGVLVAPMVITHIDENGDGAFSDAEKRAYSQRVLDDLTITADGNTVRPKLVSWSFPQPAEMREGLGEIHIEYSIDVPASGSERSLLVANHHLNGRSVYLMNALTPKDPGMQLLTQKRNRQQSLYELEYQPTHAAPLATWTRVRVWLNGIQVAELFRLGTRHIAEGTDHLLFLLVLLLPAPLLVRGGRWGQPVAVRQSLLRILGIVTAFTIGHSITLSLAALGAVTVPSRPVEVLIAASIFVSAVHAFHPIFPGKEALIAAFFGLIHGLAFAATLDRLGFGRWERVAGILSFNLGIETMQMLVVAAVLPSLMLMSKTRAYAPFRVCGALFAGFASAGWVIERLFGIHAGVDAVVNTLAQHSLWIAVGLFLASLTLVALREFRRHSEIRAPWLSHQTHGAPVQLD